ncbi:DUF4062 domain-containing protein [Anaeromyxobacter sp. Red801]|uniref:DUF4062 domain-containing protein n=1 Tax=Anaeromyxobacter sp. Red801 TaxID=3411632 RepID=UPI003BA3BED5
MNREVRGCVQLSADRTDPPTSRMLKERDRTMRVRLWVLCGIVTRLRVAEESMERRLQVFVSSTYQDLRLERQAAVEAILRAGHIPAGMELFAAGDKSQWEVIKKWIDDSDVFMLILGGRYGSIEPESGKSYVQMEYEYAVATKKPFFAVVIADTTLERRWASGDESVCERQHVAAYKEFRRLVLSKISRFFEDPKDIRIAIFETLNDFTRNREFPGGWVSAAEVSQPKPLIEEIGRLTRENGMMRAERDEAVKKLAAAEAKGGVVDGKTVRETLRNTKIEVPADVNGGKRETHNLFAVFVSVAHLFETGSVCNPYGISATQRFLFFEVAPKLAPFGLVERRKATGGKYDEFALTPAGREMAALAAVVRAKVPMGDATAKSAASKSEGSLSAERPASAASPAPARRAPRKRK